MNPLLSWLNPKRRAERDADLQRELRSHIEADAEEQATRGISEQQARRAAFLQFGNPALAAEATRDAWGWGALDRISHDIRFTFRSLRKNLGYTALAVVILALGIGANTAIFTAVNAALLKPLPFPEPERLVQVFHVAPKNVSGGGRFGVATGNFVEWHTRQHSFDGIALYHFHGLNLTSGDRPERFPGAEVSEDFFHVLGVQPVLGRVFTADEMQPGRDREVVLSYEVWQSHFGGDPNIVGRTYNFDREDYTVIAVMPQQFRFPFWAKLWVPTAWTAKDRVNRNNHNSTAIARLKAGVTLQQAQSEMDAISRGLAEVFPKEDAGWGAVVLPLRENMVGDLRPQLLVLLAAVGFVLLIACSNVANLVLAKTISRRKEIAIRGALGASRGRVLQLVLLETTMLALGGGALGLLLARYGLAVLLNYFGTRLSRSFDVRLDTSVLLFALGVSIACGILAGLLPALRFVRQDCDLHEALQQGGRTDVDSGRVHARNLLVGVEVALCTILLISAGLLLRTLWVLRSTDPGFKVKNVTAMVVPRPERADHAFNAQLLDRLRALPGIEAAGATTNIPLSSSNESTWSIQVEGQPPLPIAQQPNVATDGVTPGYFATLRIPLLRGRDFSDSDTAERPRVVIISQAMAQRFWPGQDPIGKRLFVSWTEPEKPREVIGIVGDTKDRGLERVRPMAHMYVPDAQSPNAADSFLIRSTAPSADVVAAARKAVREIDRQQPVLGIETMEEVVADSYSDRHANMTLLVAFASLALALAVAGIYGVLSYSVRRRLREIGIRLALGAKVTDVVRMVVGEGMKPTIFGVVIGMAGSLALGRLLSTMLFGVRPTDFRTYVAVAALLSLVSLVACLIPACRATRVQPLDVLRDE